MTNTTSGTFDCFSKEQVKEINREIKKNIFQKEDPSDASSTAIKTGDFFHIPCPPLMGLLSPWLHQCQHINKMHFGYDIYWNFQLEYFNYNVYGMGGTYNWHIDANTNTSIHDIKLTCLLNLSEEPYEGGEFCTINSGNQEFTSGMALIINSLIAHRVTPVTKGERITLTYWASGLAWR